MYELAKMTRQELADEMRMPGIQWPWRVRLWLGEKLIGRRRYNAHREVWARIRGAEQVIRHEGKVLTLGLMYRAMCEPCGWQGFNTTIQSWAYDMLNEHTDG